MSGHCSFNVTTPRLGQGLYHGQHDLTSLGRPWLPIRSWSFPAAFWLVLVLRSHCRLVTQRSFPSFLGRSFAWRGKNRYDGDLGYLPFTSENRKFRLENQMFCTILFGKFKEIRVVIWSEAFFLLLLVCLTDLNILWGGRSDNEKFIVLCLWTRFVPR